MGDPRGFIKSGRQESRYRQVKERLEDFRDVLCARTEKRSQEQASRCMDCGTPFCHWACPLGNTIPEWNDHMYRGNWKAALGLLEKSNNLPEITGRVCPGLCEYSCVLGLNDDPVTVRENELAIVEYGFKNGLITPKPVADRTGRKVAVIGSGPAGLACAAELNRFGHSVTVFERDDACGGILRYGIPDFKLEKHLLDRRIDIWKKEGISFKTGTDAGADVTAQRLVAGYDAVCLACGSRVPRDLKIEGRDLKGIHFAMEYLIQSNRRAAKAKIPAAESIDARGKHVVIIGGGDTGADCLGTALRQKAAGVTQVEVLPRPAECRGPEQPWPKYPLLLKNSSSHKEGGQRLWSVSTKKFVGENGHVKRMICEKNPGGEFELDADLVILAIGFLHGEHSRLTTDLGVAFDERGNVKTDGRQMTNVEKVFSAGDMRRGQSLVVWAVAEGRRAAQCIDDYLTRKSL